ncbi:zinc chelation protein SecC [Comamonas testosteroni TK102]|uniref:Zinc chelation protein SecC n=2 Tax=Comamonadaceae TaxID=80864 RepID=A0A076PRE0_COMTE|nr:zinc chelation protein SecC [Comamonas testosteroni TK102]
MQEQAPNSAAEDAALADMPEGALSNDQLEELDALLDELRTRGDEIPQWEFCDGFLTALVCTRRPIAAAEYMPMLLGDGEALQVAEGQPLPKLEAFKDEAQQARFMELFELRLAEVREQLDADIKSLADDAAFQPEALDTRGAIAILPEAEQAELAGEEVPSFSQVWALGFMFVVENWADEWAPPRDKDAAQLLDAAMEFIVNLTEDDTDEPALNLYDEAGPASTSQERVDAFGEAIWAVYDLYRLWKSMGPRQETIVKGEQPGRNDPCPCGSGKKFKKCHGA